MCMGLPRRKFALCVILSVPSLFVTRYIFMKFWIAQSG
jgi:hypothetical protein